MKKTKEQNGITLIALVITIVVLLILASITITFVLSDGGIFREANKAKWEQEAAVIRDYTLSAQTAMGLEYFNPKYAENGAGSDAPSRDSVKLGSIFMKSFPSDLYEFRVVGFYYSKKAYNSGVSGSAIVLNNRYEGVVFYVNITDGVVTVTWEDQNNSTRS